MREIPSNFPLRQNPDKTVLFADSRGRAASSASGRPASLAFWISLISPSRASIARFRRFERAGLNGFGSKLQFALIGLVTCLTRLVNVQQRAANVMVADLHRAFAFVRHMAIRTGDAGTCVDALVEHLKLRMLCFQNLGPVRLWVQSLCFTSS